MKRWLLFGLSLLLVSEAFADDPGTAGKEGKVQLYANITSVEPILEAFRASTGMHCAYTRVDTSKFLATVLTEAEAGRLQADVFQGPVPILEMLKEKGILALYKSPSAVGYPDWAARNEAVMQFGIEVVAPIYNKELVKPADVPKRYEDLADPKWKDKIVMPDPSTHTTTICWLVGLREAKVFASDEAWLRFVKGLAANRPMFVSSWGATPSPLENGEKLLAVSLPKYILTRAPSPLDWARVDPLIGSSRAIAVSSRAPSPKAARLFMDYWLAQDAMKLLADKVGEYVLAPGLFPPIDGIEKARVLPVRELSDEEIRKWGDEFHKIFFAQ